jgi:putative transposase
VERGPETHLRPAVEEFAEHDHVEHNHQGLGDRLIDGEPGTEPVHGVACDERLGGLLRFYRRAA